MVGSRRMGGPVLYGPSTVAVRPENLTSALSTGPDGAGLSRDSCGEPARAPATSGNTANSRNLLGYGGLREVRVMHGVMTADR